MITTNPPAIWRNSKKFSELIGKEGTVEYFSRLHTCSKPVVAIIKLKGESKKITLQVCGEGAAKIKIGAKVTLVLRKYDVNEEGLIKYVVKAQLV